MIRSHSRGRIVLAPALAAVAVATGLIMPAAAAAGGAPIQPPNSAAISAERNGLTYEVVDGPRAVTSMERATASVYGGPYTAYTGEQVVILASDFYQRDDEANKTYADYAASFVHNTELGRVVIVLVAPAEIDAYCGLSAAACYFPDYQAIAISPDSPTRGADLLHEYGHHIAFNRLNTPFSAYRFGPKRWATALGVCPNVRNGGLDPSVYELDPAEGFAEAYTVVNGGAWGGIVSSFFFPDTNATALIRSDVLNPWTGNFSARAAPVRLAERRRTRMEVPTPLDGRLEVSLRGPAAADFNLYLLSGKKILKRSLGPKSRERIRHTVCGVRSFTVMVHAKEGAGPATVTISKP